MAITTAVAEPEGKPMSDNKRSISINLGFPWFFFWLFTVGLADLGFWQGFWALIAWPYYLGSFVRTLLIG